VSHFELEIFILLMRYAGTAIIDAALLQDKEIVGISSSTTARKPGDRSTK
jgi:hypothetical protein